MGSDITLFTRGKDKLGLELKGTFSRLSGMIGVSGWLFCDIKVFINRFNIQ